jgi:hypothetical protein
MFNSGQFFMAVPPHHHGMPDTGERRPITRFANAKEAETVHESRNLDSKTKQDAAEAVRENRSRGRRNFSSGKTAKPAEAPAKKGEQQLDQEASARMVDEGDPSKSSTETIPPGPNSKKQGK